ncbi:MAG: NitT/TauT family transport system ATP-binding protein [Ramlibacter sp.]|jgi:NitT/TauT family transport system ATP-binding protein|nr:NitT/TauT family transport system ATP-binding protein [Ramlibacter sp.]
MKKDAFLPYTISVEHLGKTYKSADGQALVALKDLSFEIQDGEFICLVGPSGCGKSTLLKILGGLLKRTSGAARIGERSLDGPGPDIGFVFQAPTLLPWRTILENVLLPTEIRRLPVEQFRAKALELLAMVGLAGFENRYSSELSGGMQQRAAIVRALVQDPPVLLMDEPFGALDALTREQMNLEVLKIWSRTKKTVVFVTHSIAEAVFLADRVFVMTPRPGKIDEIINIELPRPRDLSLINTDKFGVYASRIRQLLQAKGDLS